MTIDQFNFAGKKGIRSCGLQRTLGRKLQHYR